jgi:serine/threonine protein kinase
MLQSGMVVGAGVILGGKYQLISEIGRGGMGTVWSAKRIDLDAIVAVKLMKGDVPATPTALERFRREAKSAAALRGPHVVQILDYGVDEATQTPFISMELLEGASLRERLEVNGRLPPAQVANIIAQAARGLARAHAASIVHRDLKPENVFLVRNEDTELVKLLDFGIAKAESRSGQFATATGTVIGTPHYMSPEQVELARSVDHRADLWSLGVIAAECLLGQRPFDAETLPELAMKICLGRARVPSEVCPVPIGFDAFFAKACAVDPDRRFQSATELARALGEVCAQPLTVTPRGAATELGATVRLESSGSMGNLARAAGASANAPRSPRRRLLIGGVVACCTLALVGGVLLVRGLGVWRGIASSSVDPRALPPASAAMTSPPPSSEPVVPPEPVVASEPVAPKPVAPPERLDAVRQPEGPAPGAKPGEPRRAAQRSRADVRRLPAGPAKTIDPFDVQ